jgi:hypothetical protein
VKRGDLECDAMTPRALALHFPSQDIFQNQSKPLTARTSHGENCAISNLAKVDLL